MLLQMVTLKNGIIKHALRNNDNNNTYNDITCARIYIKIKYSGESFKVQWKKPFSKRL